MSDNPVLAVSAPGRICLFGDHQDFLGLAVIAAAIDRRITITGVPRRDALISLSLPDIGGSDCFDPAEEIPYRAPRDYLRSVPNVLRRRGVRWPGGFDCTVRGDIPINAGVSSSSALVIAWTYFLLAAADPDTRPDPLDVARIGHQAEVLEFREPGGMMDHYTSSLGGLVYIDCGGDISVTPIPRPLDGFVLGDSLEPKDTMGVLKQSKEDALLGVRLMEEKCPGFHFRTSTLERVEPYLAGLPERARRKVHANVVNWEITGRARRLLTDGPFDPADLGALIDRHHAMLRDGIGVSTPKIERMIEAAKSAGALGAKVNGSGGGGTMIAYAPGCEAAVAKAINRSGGRAGAVVIDRGAGKE
jgi:galactokinase